MTFGLLLSLCHIPIPPPLYTPYPRYNTPKMTWQPQQQGLEEVLSMLRSSSSGDSEVQKAVSHVCSKTSLHQLLTLLYESQNSSWDA
jgi:hypothetical protein